MCLVDGLACCCCLCARACVWFVLISFIVHPCLACLKRLASVFLPVVQNLWTNVDEIFPAVLSVFVVTPRWTVDTVPPDTIVDTGPSQEGEAPRPEEADPFLFFTFHCRSVAAAAAAAAAAMLLAVSCRHSPRRG